MLRQYYAQACETTNHHNQDEKHIVTFQRSLHPRAPLLFLMVRMLNTRSTPLNFQVHNTILLPAGISHCCTWYISYLFQYVGTVFVFKYITMYAFIYLWDWVLLWVQAGNSCIAQVGLKLPVILPSPSVSQVLRWRVWTTMPGSVFIYFIKTYPNTPKNIWENLNFSKC